jgi:hypothetical protein
MDILQESSDKSKISFFSHVFSTTQEDKGELLNVVQYSLLGVAPVVILNKLIQRFIPEADSEKSSLELLAEILIQLIVIFCGIVLIHRTITYIPTYSGFKYENFVLTNVILAFLVIVLSIQSKIGIKVNILVDRINDLWNGSSEDKKTNLKNGVRVSQPVSRHMPSQADYLDNSSTQNDMFPPAPVAVQRPNQMNESYGNMRGGQQPLEMYNPGPMAANSILGGAFGSVF